jgi:hypothetical protein
MNLDVIGKLNASTTPAARLSPFRKKRWSAGRPSGGGRMVSRGGRPALWDEVSFRFRSQGSLRTQGVPRRTESWAILDSSLRDEWGGLGTCAFPCLKRGRNQESGPHSTAIALQSSLGAGFRLRSPPRPPLRRGTLVSWPVCIPESWTGRHFFCGLKPLILKRKLGGFAIRASASRLDKGLLAMPQKYRSLFPDNGDLIGVLFDDGEDLEELTFQPYDPVVKENRVLGLARWYSRRGVRVRPTPKLPLTSTQPYTPTAWAAA